MTEQEKQLTRDRIGLRILTLRKMQKLTQEELAEKLEVSPQAVSKWENGQSYPDISLIPRLAAIFGVTTDLLLTGEKETTPPVKLLPPEERKNIKDMMLRILIESADGDKVRVNLPMALVQVAMDMGMELPQVNGNDALKNIDLGKILELVRHGAIGNLVEVESTDGDTVKVFVE